MINSNWQKLSRLEMQSVLGGVYESGGTTSYCHFTVVAPNGIGGTEHVQYSDTVISSDHGCSGLGSAANNICVSLIENNGLPNCHYHCDGC